MKTRPATVHGAASAMTEDVLIGRPAILCVDGAADSRQVLSRALAQYELFLASTGFEALRAINARSFHAYILEYWLPDWTGRGLCQEIRTRDPHAPIMFCTAASSSLEKARGLRAGANAYLTKPLDPELLRSRIRAAMAAADQASLDAKFDEECAIQDELARRAQHARDRAEAAKQLSASSGERTARAKALKAFIESGGTLGHFDSWWPQVYSSVRANHAMWQLTEAEDTRD